MSEFEFKPSFDVSWDTPASTTTTSPQSSPSKSQPQNISQQQAQPQTKTIIETFDIDNAFVGFKPSFKTEVDPIEIKMPEEVPPIDTLEGTVAAQIFGAYCQNKFGFKLVLDKA